MPRKLRVEYRGAIDHVMRRANGKGDIFLDDVDRQDFLKTLAEGCLKTGFEIHACCLMRDRFHLVVETHRTMFGISNVRSHSALASRGQTCQSPDWIA
jgi:putative transposase